MEHPVLTAVRRASLTTFGWFEPGPGDGLPDGIRFVILIGNAGPDMFRRFASERDPAVDTLDNWTRDVVERLADDLGAKAVFPFDRPHPPILTWARRAGAGHASPLGLNIHHTYGLWHAYRAVLLFPVAFDLPKVSLGSHPCESCATKPCLSACPVGAFDGRSYDVSSCVSHLGSVAGEPCMAAGCLARRACPVGQGFAYESRQMQFHMKAFLAAQRLTGS
jgi:epoxyqueuosine reductase QueG